MQPWTLRAVQVVSKSSEVRHLFELARSNHLAGTRRRKSQQWAGLRTALENVSELPDGQASPQYMAGRPEHGQASLQHMSCPPPRRPPSMRRSRRPRAPHSRACPAPGTSPTCVEAGRKAALTHVNEHVPYQGMCLGKAWLCGATVSGLAGLPCQQLCKPSPRARAGATAHLPGPAELQMLGRCAGNLASQGLRKAKHRAGCAGRGACATRASLLHRPVH